MRPLSAPALPALIAATLLAACSQPAGDAPAAPDAGSGPVAETPAAPTPDPAAPPAAEGEQGGTDSWRALASPDDRTRLERLGEAWRQALAEADEKGFGDQIAALGQLADAEAGQAASAPPSPGDYRCRSIKIGSMNGQGLGYVAYPSFRCTVELTPGGDLILMKTTGSQRTRGLIYPDDRLGFVYLGAQAWGDEAHYPNYGQQPERNHIGVVQRLGGNHWRLVLPFPRQEAKLEILELTR